MAPKQRNRDTLADGDEPINSTALNKVCRAAGSCNFAELKTLLDGECARARVGVTTTGKPENGGLSALHYAACSDTDFVSGKLEVLTFCAKLAESEGRVNVRDAKGRTPLHCAVEKFAGNVDKHTMIWNTAELLIAHGARLDLVDKDGKLSLDYFPAAYHATRDTYRKALEPKVENYKPPLPQAALVLEADDRSHVIDKLATMITNRSPRHELEKVLKEHSHLHDLINGRTSRGDSLLAFAVKLNSVDMVHWLTEHDIDVDVVNKDGRTALHYALTAGRFDGTDMVRVLLSKGADPLEPFDGKTPMQLAKNVSQRYWLRHAIKTYDPEKYAFVKKEYRKNGLQRVLELDYLAVGQKVARSMVQEYITTFSRHRQAFQNKPLVLLLPGPPGHGKTWSARNIAKALSTDEDSFLEVAMGAVNDKADLFGGSPFGGGTDVVRGTLCGYLLDRAGLPSVVLLDEIEKCLFDTDNRGQLAMKTNTGGWPLGSRIMSAMLEPFQEGTLSVDPKWKDKFGKKMRGAKIDCSKTVFILTSNWAQHEIAEWCRSNSARLNSETSFSWVQKPLIDDIVSPMVMEILKTDKNSGPALHSRINFIIPYMPLTEMERQVAIDSLMRATLGRYAEKPREEDGQAIGNALIGFTMQCRDRVAALYDPILGYRPCTSQLTGPILTAIDQDWLRARGWPTEPGKLTKVWVDYSDDKGYTVTHTQPSELSLDDSNKDVLSNVLAPPTVAYPMASKASSVADVSAGPGPPPTVAWE